MPLNLCAVSRFPCSSTRRNTFRNSGAVISATGRDPIHGKTRRSNRARTFFAVFCVKLVFWECHSRATASKVFAAAAILAAFCVCFISAGSMLLAICVRASCWRLRASAIEISGYFPMDSSFSFPSIRYFMRHSFPPDGVTTRYRPPPSGFLYAFSAGFSLLTSLSVSFPINTPIAWGYIIFSRGYFHQNIPPTYPRLHDIA